jgi:hypothetical protein
MKAYSVVTILARAIFHGDLLVPLFRIECGVILRMPVWEYVYWDRIFIYFLVLLGVASSLHPVQVGLFHEHLELPSEKEDSC